MLSGGLNHPSLLSKFVGKPLRRKRTSRTDHGTDVSPTGGLDTRKQAATIVHTGLAVLLRLAPPCIIM